MLLQLPIRAHGTLRLRALLLGSRCSREPLLSLLLLLLLLLLAVGLELGTGLLERLVLRELGVGHMWAWQHRGLRQLGARLLQRVAGQGLVACGGEAHGAPDVQVVPCGAVHRGQAWQGLFHPARLQAEDRHAEHSCLALSACQQSVQPWSRPPGPPAGEERCGKE